MAARKKAKGFFWDGYIHWARTIDEVTAHNRTSARRPKLYEPVFVQMVTTPAKPALQALSDLIDTMRADDSSARDLLRAIARQPGFGFLKRKHGLILDIDDFCIGLQHSLLLGELLEFFLYRPVALTKKDHAAHVSDFTVVDVGAPALVAQRGSARPIAAPDDPEAKNAPVVGAVIDNDIGFLNDQFCRPGAQGRKSRFAAIWLQARETATTGGGHGVHAELGRVLTRAEINRILARDRRDEATIYREINSGLHLLDRFHQAPPQSTHGTAVADLAFGPKADDPDGGARMARLPLLAVQLPPEAAMDTSGTHSESYIVQGVRWLCAYARRCFPRAKLVINISYGTLAGQKNGSKFIEAQIAREVTLARRYPVNNGKGQEVHVVYAFGNSRNARQLAELTVAPGQSSDPLEWTVPPDNGLPAFLEIRAVTQADGRPRLGAVPPEIALSVTAPDGSRHALAAEEGEADPPLNARAEMTPLRLFHVPGRSTAPRKAAAAFYNLAIAPTRGLGDGIAQAPAGNWQLRFDNTGSTPVKLVLQIQRGDTAPGFATGGRQSFFDVPYRDTTVKGYPARDVSPPLTNAGSHSAYTTAATGQIHTAGALQQIFEDTRAAEYSGQGAPWSTVQAPSQVRVVDGLFTYGKPAAGTYSGGRTRLSGTSAAAALVSRDLV